MPYTRLRYHIVFATKGRARWIRPEVETFLYPVLGRVTKNLGGQSIRIGGIEDHVHLICALQPSICIEDFLRDLKSNSSAAVRGRFKNMYGFEWQRSYGCFTLNPFDMDSIVAYVENQKHHHRNNDTHKLWERIDQTR